MIFFNTKLISFVSITIFLVCPLSNINGQHENSPNDNATLHLESASHFRGAILIGHTLIRSEGSNTYLFVPSWGLDLEYWFNSSLGIGLHNDIEIESFIIKQSGQEEIERVNPLVFTLDILYRFENGIVISAGPGLEYEHGKSFYLGRLGLEYEKNIGNGYDICPSIFYDYRLDGFSTFTISLGIGKIF